MTLLNKSDETPAPSFSFSLAENNLSVFVPTDPFLSNTASSSLTSPNCTVAPSLSSPPYNFYAVLLVLLIFCVVFGNVLVCLAVSRERALQTTTNYLIVSLAVSDLLLAILVMPWGVYLEVVGEWRFSLIHCDILLTLDVMMCTASILNLCAISIDRSGRKPKYLERTCCNAERACKLHPDVDWLSGQDTSLTLPVDYDQRSDIMTLLNKSDETPAPSFSFSLAENNLSVFAPTDPFLSNTASSSLTSPNCTVAPSLSSPPYNFYAVLLVLLIFCVVFGNVLVCLAVSRERALQTTTNYLIVSLAVSDLLLAILVMPWGVYLEVCPHCSQLNFGAISPACLLSPQPAPFDSL
ncbi:hypothetical protein WMY93_026623 [Mugilogobius chulae]|uniref:G-protein coupled receptors family 1 profile domain-containing protein n=1 Tax=Mugilogobius chulae TaxID=88201 RepID=A0AAW0N4V2_9GOBI